MYTRRQPFLASISARYGLCARESSKEIYHLSLDLSGSGIRYRVGDSVGILPHNDRVEVERIIASLGAEPEDPVVDREGVTWPLYDFLQQKAELATITKRLIEAAVVADPSLRQVLEHPERLKDFCKEFSAWEIIQRCPQGFISPQRFIELIQPLLPRFYSIASSSLAVGEQVDLTVAYLKYSTHGLVKMGICSHFLCKLAALGQKCVPLYVQPSPHFHLPEDTSAAVIMIGPGTGIAPFRGFLQERVAQGATGAHWLFFGERTYAHDYLYQADWERWHHQGFLKLSLAFSRDQAEKIYVQHRMEQEGEALFRWLEEGAYLYLCGDAHHMAKDVEATLIRIVERWGHRTPEAAQDYIKTLRRDKRYLKDVY